jgi:glucose-6-phosphate isomerase
MSLTSSPAWRALMAMTRTQLDTRVLFGADPRRVGRYTLSLDERFVVDYSKQQITEESMALLASLARQQEVEKRRNAMFAGEAVNSSEKRAVLHIALRAADDASCKVGGSDVMPEVLRVRKKLYAFADAVRTGTWTGATGQPIKTVLHIGIGGSHLGPEMVVKALRPYHDGPAVRFVANVDPADLAANLAGLDPATTLVVVASKTFTTQETMANARAARAWLVAKLGDAAVAKHFVAASTNVGEVKNFGIDGNNMFPFSDWVGGRYSLWSSIGLPIILAIGPTRFDELLAGARSMDEHFRTADLHHNIPILLGLIDVWNRNFLRRPSLAILPYSQDLRELPAYLQQLMMESNGKSVDRDGVPADLLTCPVVFGQPGTNGQHAFHQQLHQGPEIIPADFIVALSPAEADEALAPGQHRLLVLNAFAQAAALLAGCSNDDPHRVMSGNRPSTTILLDRLSPFSLGRLLALYEHRVAVAGWLWNINSFDQFGVELGKDIANRLLLGETGDFDASTRALMGRLG